MKNRFDEGEFDKKSIEKESAKKYSKWRKKVRLAKRDMWNDLLK